MCAALSNDNTLDGCPADRTGFAFALINTEFILEMPSLVCPVKGRTILLYGMLQRFSYRAAQLPARRDNGVPGSCGTLPDR